MNLPGFSSIHAEINQNPGLATDLYELTMAQAYLESGIEGPATFSLSIRTLPPDWGFFVFAGLEALLDALRSFRFSAGALEYLGCTGLFSPRLLSYLDGFRFSGEVWALAEGEIFFAGEPLLEVTAPVIEAQIVETLVINLASLSTLAASKACRCVLAARGKDLVEFGFRRAQGLEAGLSVARSSYLAGFASTSNVLAGKMFGIPVAGTMAHSFVEAFADEEAAFRAFAGSFPQASVLLVDTYDTLAGVRKAARVGRELAARGITLKGVRLDSGDLLDLARRARAILNEAGLKETAIFASGGLDEAEIARLVESGAPIDAFGVGTSLAVVRDAPAVEIAYKLVDYGGAPRLKLSAGKATLPGRKQLFRTYGDGGAPEADVIGLWSEAGPRGSLPLLVKIMEGGELTSPLPGLGASRSALAERIERLPPGLRRLENPAAFPVSLTPELDRLARELRVKPR